MSRRYLELDVIQLVCWCFAIPQSQSAHTEDRSDHPNIAPGSPKRAPLRSRSCRHAMLGKWNPILVGLEVTLMSHTTCDRNYFHKQGPSLPDSSGVLNNYVGSKYTIRKPTNGCVYSLVHCCRQTLKSGTGTMIYFENRGKSYIQCNTPRLC